MLERDLGGYDCVFLCDVAQFTASEARVLDAYLDHGGNLVFFLGDRCWPSATIASWAGGAGRRASLPARLGDRRRTRPNRASIPLDYRHPIVRAFRGEREVGAADHAGRESVAAWRLPSELDGAKSCWPPATAIR